MAGTVAVYALGAAGVGAATYIAARRVKQKLTHFIADSISEYFDVDPDSIRTSLSTSGKLDLTNVRLKPQILSSKEDENGGCGKVMTLGLGEVDAMSFSWHWGTSILKDAKLTVSGARLQIVVVTTAALTDDDNINQKPKVSSSNQASSPPPTEQPQQPVEDNDSDATLQHILDQLLLIIEDITITVEGVKTKGESSATPHTVAIAAKAVRLLPLGRKDDDGHHDKNDPLLEEFVVESLGAHIPGGNVKKDDFWIVEPFGYKAKIQKTGKRFENLETGLEVIGEVVVPATANKDDEGLTIHAGETQIRTVLGITDNVMRSLFSTGSSSGGDDDADQSVSDAPAPSSSATTSEEEATNDNDSSLMIVLPIPSVTLVLPTGSTITTHYWQFSYRVDGSKCKLQGTGAGVYLKDDFRFAALEKNVQCVVDLKEGVVLVETNKDASERMEEGTGDESRTIAHLEWKEAEMRPVLQGIRQALDLFSPAAELEPAVATTAAGEETRSPSSVTTLENNPAAKTPWSLVVDGKITYRFEGQVPPTTPDAEEETATQWVEAVLDSPNFVLADRTDEIPSLLSIQGAVIGPSSFADMTLKFSSIRLESKSVNEKVVDDMHQFLYHVLGMDTWK